MTTQPGTQPLSVPLPRRWGTRATDVVALLAANGVFIVLMWLRHGGLDQLGHAGRPVHGRRPAHRPPWHLPRADPARAHGPQPLARRGVRHGPARVGPPVAGVRDDLADRRPRRPDDRRATRWATARASSPRRSRCSRPSRTCCGRRPASGCSCSSASRRFAPPVAGCPTRPGTGSTSTPTSRSRWRSCTSCSSGADFMHDQLAAIYWIGLYVAHGGARAHVPHRPAARSPSVRHRLRVSAVVQEASGRRLDLPRRPGPRPARGALGPVLRPSVPDPRRLVARPPVLDLVRAERPMAAVHGQGPGRRQRADRTPFRSGHVCSSRARTAS